MPFSFDILTFWFASLLTWFCLAGVHGYIPASPSNDSAINVSGANASHLDLQWAGGAYEEDISYQLVGANSNGVSLGVLVHFSEDKLTTNDTTTTPWIALVACDGNATDASQVDDIFTLAKDRGAVAALLYSLYSQNCVINPDYADPANFDQVMDIFATPSLPSSRFIETEYAAQNITKLGHYDSGLLNSSAAEINSSLSGGTMSKGFMLATLTAFNATGPTPSTPGSGATSTAAPSGGGGGPNTSLAMIILYAITGCVSALFCVVIVSGAIRAIRHPERYGPRSGDPTFGGAPGSGFGSAQSRARGLTRAILDTFPVVKFGRSETDLPEHVKDVESYPDNRALEMRDLEEGEDRSEGSRDVKEKERVQTPDERRSDESQVASSSGSPSPGSVLRPRPTIRIQEPNTPAEEHVVPDAIGRETCPICIVDFEEGDDLRVLPCEGHHRFHQSCVDPWLLELSSSCPICRQDFHILETMMNSDGGDHLEPPPPLGSVRPLSGAGARFSRYLRSARRRRGRNNREGAFGDDPTNPAWPMAPETSL